MASVVSLSQRLPVTRTSTTLRASRAPRAALRCAAIYIDRRQHLELAWRRQADREALLRAELVPGRVSEVADLEHLDALIERAGSQLVVLACYTRSCGACKALLSHVEALAEEAKAAQARAIFARHSLHDEFDAWSDVAVWHRVRAVPTVLFLDGGAVVKRLTLHDVRRLGERATTYEQVLAQDLRVLRQTFRQLVFEKAPGSRS